MANFARAPPQRNLPARGPFRPRPLLAGGALLMIFGWYKLIVGIREQKYVARQPSPAPTTLWRLIPPRPRPLILILILILTVHPPFPQ